MLKELTLDLIELGAAKEAVNQALAKAGDDVTGRAHIEKPRTITLTISLTPRLKHLGEGQLPVNQPDVEWNIKSSLPGEKGMATKAIVKNGKVLYDDAGAQTPADMFHDAHNKVRQIGG